MRGRTRGSRGRETKEKRRFTTRGRQGGQRRRAKEYREGSQGGREAQGREG